MIYTFYSLAQEAFRVHIQWLPFIGDDFFTFSAIDSVLSATDILLFAWGCSLMSFQTHLYGLSFNEMYDPNEINPNDNVLIV